MTYKLTFHCEEFDDLLWTLKAVDTQNQRPRKVNTTTGRKRSSAKGFHREVRVSLDWTTLALLSDEDKERIGRGFAESAARFESISTMQR